MTDEQFLLNAFAGMKPWARGIVVELVAAYAIDFPAEDHQSAWIAVKPTSNDIDQPVNRLPLVIVSEAVDG